MSVKLTFLEAAAAIRSLPTILPDDMYGQYFYDGIFTDPITGRRFTYYTDCNCIFCTRLREEIKKWLSHYAPSHDYVFFNRPDMELSWARACGDIIDYHEE